MNNATHHADKVLAYLRMHGSMATRDGRQILEVPSICDAVFRLRKRGVPIRTAWTYLCDSRGRRRRVGRYYLAAGSEQ